MRIAVCDFDKKYLDSLLSYLYGKCGNSDFASFTTIADYVDATMHNPYDYTVMGDEFFSSWKGQADYNEDKLECCGKLIILSATVDNLQSKEAYQVIYKYGPMDGLYRMMAPDNRKTSDSNKVAVYSPWHHELTEMYGLSLCQILAEEKKVLLVDTMNCPVIRKLIRDGPRGGLIDVVYKLENRKQDEIKELIEAYDNIDVLPLALGPLDVASINRTQWKMLIDYADSLHYQVYVFLVEDINSGFKEIMSYVDRCFLINKRGDYYADTQDYMRDCISNVGTETISIDLHMSANNLNKGCYQLEELLTGNLGRFVRTQYYSATSS